MSSVAFQGEMYLFGGYDMNSEPNNDCYKFNLGKGREQMRRNRERVAERKRNKQFILIRTKAMGQS